MENKEEINVSPAVSPRSPPAQLTPQEFQRQLYSWFEEKGLFGDLRSYLRVQMINRLRETKVGRTESKSNFSLPKQALSLVIAEHLMRENCHYTLSIFSTEAPGVANQLPMSLLEPNYSDQISRFNEESLLNLLELIGIPKDSDECLRIMGHYFKDYGSLLSCLIKSKKVDTLTGVYSEGNLNNGNIDEYLNKIMPLFGVPPNLIKDICSKIEQKINIEQERHTISAKRHFGKIVDGLKTEIHGRNEHIERLVTVKSNVEQNNKEIRLELERIKQSVISDNSWKIKEAMLSGKLAELEKEMNKCSGVHCGQSCRNQIRQNEELQMEISRMRNEDKVRSLELERLQEKIIILDKELEGSRMKIQFLNSCLLRTNQINLSKTNEIVEDSDSSENITEGILVEVKSKLQQLEMESEKLDLKLKKLRL